MSFRVGPVDFWTGTTKEGRAHIAARGVVQTQLVLNLDAGVANSYSGSGSTWNNLAGASNATLVNAPTYSTDNGGSIVFDGVDDYVTADGILTDSFLQQSWTISLWINHLSLPNYAIQSDIVYIQHGSSVGSSGLHLDSRNGYFYFGLFNDDAYTIEEFVEINKWYNIVYTYNHLTYEKQIFLNGYKREIIKSGVYGRPYIGTGNNARIGSPVLGFGNHFNGLIPIVHAYNRVLTESEVAQNFNCLRWRFNI